MLTATLTTTFDLTSVRLRDGDIHVATYPITRGDGPGPVPAATAVLERHGWRVAGEWEHDSGGITGDVWTATAEQTTQA